MKREGVHFAMQYDIHKPSVRVLAISAQHAACNSCAEHARREDNACEVTPKLTFPTDGVFNAACATYRPKEAYTACTGTMLTVGDHGAPCCQHLGHCS